MKVMGTRRVVIEVPTMFGFSPVVAGVLGAIIALALLAMIGCGVHDQKYYDNRVAFLEEVQKEGHRGDLILCPDGQVWHYLAGLTIQRAPGLPVTTGDTLEVRYQPGMKLIRYQPTAMWAEYAHKYLAK